jgi:hypothetical protein
MDAREPTADVDDSLRPAVFSLDSRSSFFKAKYVDMNRFTANSGSSRIGASAMYFLNSTTSFSIFVE